MRRINLIPPEFATGKKALVETGLRRKALVIGVVFFSAVLIHYTVSWIAFSALRKQMTELRRGLDQAHTTSDTVQKSKEAITAQLDHLKEQTTTLSGRKTSLHELENTQSKWSEALDAFHKIIPEKVWVDELVLDEKLSRVKGGTFGNQYVSAFIDNLNQSPYFSNATFVKTEAGTLNKQPVVNFELTFEMHKKHG